MRSRLLLLRCALLIAVGCDDDESGSDALLTPGAPECAQIGEVAVLRRTPAPGGGTELAVRVLDVAERTPLPQRFVGCLEGTQGTVVVAPRELPAGNVLVLAAAPHSQAEAESLNQAFVALVDSRPAGERLALHRWGTTVDQVTDFTRDRTRLKLLAAETLGPSTETERLSAGEAVTRARGTVELVADGDPVALAALVILGGDEMPPLEAKPRASVVVWVRLAEGASAAAASASAALDAAYEGGFAGVGTCGLNFLELRYGRRGQEKTTQMTLPKAYPDEAKLACDAEASAKGSRIYPKRLEFVFNAEQRQAYRDRLSQRSKAKFEVSVQLGDAEPIPAEAKLRGHGGMLCARKSYSVNLEADGPRAIMPGVMEDEFFLNSMCWDQQYLENYTYNQLLAEMDLFPMRSEIVELVLDGKSEGIYIMVEKPHEAMEKDSARAVGVVRRNHELENQPEEVKLFQDGAKPELLADYHALLSTAQSTSGQDLVNQMRSRIAFDHFLKYIATMTVLHNSDYGDEVRFLATERTGHDPRLYFEISAWDPEDILREECVWIQYAFHDPNDLVWCAEGQLENAVLGDPAVYAIYVEQLELALATLTEEKMDAALARTKEKVLPFFEDAAIRESSRDRYSDTSSAQAMKAQFESRERTIRRRFTSWRAELAQKIAAYRQ